MAEIEEEPVSNSEPVQTRTTQTQPVQSQPVSRSQATPTEDPDKLHGKALAIRIIWFVNGFLMAILGLRFVLALLGANPYSGFGNFIYSITQPFVAPFFGVFSYSSNNYVAGEMYFEGYTLLAMLVYTLAAWGITKLITINHRDSAVPA